MQKWGNELPFNIGDTPETIESRGSPEKEPHDAALEEYLKLSDLLEHWLKGKVAAYSQKDEPDLSNPVIYTHPKLLPLYIHTLRYMFLLLAI